MNKEVKAQILLERNSEFLNFIATAENISNSDFNVKYSLMVFQTEENGDISKTNDENLLFIKSGTKIILPSVTVNYNISQKIIIVLLIYDLDNKPIGQDRIVLENGGQTDLAHFDDLDLDDYFTYDQAKPQDGFIIDGLVIENTITKSGKDFYRYFYAEYFNLQVKSSRNIIIEEVPGRGRFTRISVIVENQVVWQFFAQPKKEILKQNASRALDLSISYLQQLEKSKKDFIRY
ncbi:CsgE family curli-type amyloid fiber assembly protein [Leeuwenhoekiella sp. NPDC079379]|uniref:CsgE family curli-type amyloid fiber assembly protein n=1 Tax=Leeuwenhoekiella sp. NPDC079379 TaxID=3364122 RepID=UPI0037C73191